MFFLGTNVLFSNHLISLLLLKNSEQQKRVSLPPCNILTYSELVAVDKWNRKCNKMEKILFSISPLGERNICGKKKYFANPWDDGEGSEAGILQSQ